jgi:hypothetical protein
LALAKARSSTSGSRRTSMRQKNSVAAMSDATADQAMVSSANQSQRSPSSSTYSSAPRNTAINTSPVRSKLRRSA